PRSFIRARNCFCSSGDMSLNRSIMRARLSLSDAPASPLLPPKPLPPRPPAPPSNPPERSPNEPRLSRPPLTEGPCCADTDGPGGVGLPTAAGGWLVADPDPAGLLMVGRSASAETSPQPRPPWPRPPRENWVSVGGVWLRAAKISFVGRNRMAAFGTRRTSERVAICTRGFAVLPGFRLSSGFGTLMIVPYVVTFWTTTGCSRICATDPSNSWPGEASTRNGTVLPGRM